MIKVKKLKEGLFVSLEVDIIDSGIVGIFGITHQLLNSLECERIDGLEKFLQELAAVKPRLVEFE